jgi:hypothetical protein
MKILVIVDNIGKIESLAYYYWVKSFNNAFKDSSEHELIVRYISQSDIWSPTHLTQVLLETDYDIAIVSPLWHVHVQLDAAKKIGKKLFIVIWDSHSPIITSNRDTNFRIFLNSKPVCGHTFVHTCNEYAQHCNVLIVDYGCGEIASNIYEVPSMQDSTLFYPITEEEKKQELLFFGQLSTHERKYFINNLKKTNLPLSNFTGNGTMNWENFAKTVRETKMYLVFNETYTRLGHRKGKIYEAAACGILPLATHPDVYSYKDKKCFIEGKHFVSINKSNYIDVIKYYLDNPEKRIEISKEAHSHYMEHFSEKPFWYNIFKYAKDN